MQGGGRKQKVKEKEIRTVCQGYVSEHLLTVDAKWVRDVGAVQEQQGASRDTHSSDDTWAAERAGAALSAFKGPKATKAPRATRRDTRHAATPTRTAHTAKTVRSGSPLKARLGSAPTRLDSAGARH